MKKSRLFLYLSIAAMVSSCSVVKKSVSSDTLDIKKSEVITKPQIAEISIENKKIDGYARIRKKDYYPNPKEACTNLAINDAVTKAKCDFVVQPMYEIEEDKSFISVKVSGFAGFYKKFRDMVESDTAAFKAQEKINKTTDVSTAKPKSVTKYSKKSPTKAVTTTIITASILSLLLIIANL